MHRAFVLFGCCVGMLAFAASCSVPNQPPARPLAAFRATTLDLGSIVSGMPFEGEFLVRNDGGGILRLDRLRVAADCEARASHDQIPAAATASVHIRCDTSRRSGKLRRTVTVYSNDARQPAQTLALTATVQSDLEVRPASLYAGRVRPGDTLREEIVVRGAGPRDGSLRAEGAIDASWQPGSDGNTARIRVRIAATAPPGVLRGSLQITGPGARTGWSIPVVGFVESQPS